MQYRQLNWFMIIFCYVISVITLFSLHIGSIYHVLSHEYHEKQNRKQLLACQIGKIPGPRPSCFATSCVPAELPTGSSAKSLGSYWGNIEGSALEMMIRPGIGWLGAKNGWFLTDGTWQEMSALEKRTWLYNIIVYWYCGSCVLSMFFQSAIANDVTRRLWEELDLYPITNQEPQKPDEETTVLIHTDPKNEEVSIVGRPVAIRAMSWPWVDPGVPRVSNALSRSLGRVVGSYWT